MASGKKAWWPIATGRKTRAEPGGREHFLWLVRENESLLLRVALRLANGDRDLAEDCVQNAIVSAFTAIQAGKFSDFENFRPWILRILTNAFLREARKDRRWSTETDLDDVPDSNPDAHEVLAVGQLSEELRLAMSALSSDQRACVTLVHLEGMEYAEAAEVLGWPVGTVRSRLARARLKMAEIITAHRED